MFEHQDILNELNSNLPIDIKLVAVHRVLQDRFNFVDRIAIALYDQKTDTVKTFLDTNNDGSPLVHYQARLSDSPSLRQILETGSPRIIEDIAANDDKPHEHTQKLRSHGYRSSYTMPMYVSGDFFGFVFC